MKKHIRYGLMLAVFNLPVIAFAGDTTEMAVEKPDFKSVTAAATSWKNQSGSTMSLDFAVDPSNPNIGIVTGSYINNAAGYACQGTPYPVTGRYYTNNLAISFNAVWSNAYANCQSVTGWTGYFAYTSSGWQIVTNWNLAYETGSGQMTIASGADTFTMTGTTTYKSLKAED